MSNRGVTASTAIEELCNLGKTDDGKPKNNAYFSELQIAILFHISFPLHLVKKISYDLFIVN